MTDQTIWEIAKALVFVWSAASAVEVLKILIIRLYYLAVEKTFVGKE